MRATSNRQLAAALGVSETAVRKALAAERISRDADGGFDVAEDSIPELCRRKGITERLYYSWSKEFLEAGKKRLAGDTALQPLRRLRRAAWPRLDRDDARGGGDRDPRGGRENP